jgi:DNA-binding NarL/FixJ family response regulator
MKEQRAREILQALVQGVDPFTGEELPSGTILQEADVLRALLAGVMALEQTAARAQRRAQLPDNVGRSWSSDEEATLVAAFKSGVSVTEIATRHGRTVRAIEARLERLGLITPEQRSTDNSFVRDDGTWEAPGDDGLSTEDASRSQPP